MNRLKLSACSSGVFVLDVQFWKEEAYLTRLHHENVVQYYGYCREDPFGYTVFEPGLLGSLYHFLRSEGVSGHTAVFTTAMHGEIWGVHAFTSFIACAKKAEFMSTLDKDVSHQNLVLLMLTEPFFCTRTGPDKIQRKARARIAGSS